MTTMTTSAPRGAKDGISKIYAGTQIVETRITPDAKRANHKRKKAMREFLKYAIREKYKQIKYTQDQQKLRSEIARLWRLLRATKS